jgi:hypothetical protein
MEPEAVIERRFSLSDAVLVVGFGTENETDYW